MKYRIIRTKYPDVVFTVQIKRFFFWADIPHSWRYSQVLCKFLPVTNFLSCEEADTFLEYLKTCNPPTKPEKYTVVKISYVP